MEMRIRSILQTMEHHDLVRLNQKIQKGNFDFNSILKDTIALKEKEHVKYCSVCGNDLDPNSTTNYTIMFGPEDFKKKASFCALDCMEFFISKLKGMNKSRESVEQEIEN